MSDTPLPQITRIDFTQRERALLSKVFDVASTFVLSLYGVKGSVEDAKNVKIVMDSPAEVADLLLKINRDRVAPHDIALAGVMSALDAGLNKQRFEEIKATLEIAKQRRIKADGQVPKIYNDMQWLVDELERRL